MNYLESYGKRTLNGILKYGNKKDMKIRYYTDYTGAFQADINDFIESANIISDQIISITNSNSRTTLWYWIVD